MTFVGVGSTASSAPSSARPDRRARRPSDCTSLAGTSDYGSSWYGVSAPVAPGPDGSTGVSQLRFANIRDGWAFGPALYETSGGGWPWHKEDTFGQRVIDVEAAAAGTPIAVFATCAGTGPDYAARLHELLCSTRRGGQQDLDAVACPPDSPRSATSGGLGRHWYVGGARSTAHANRTGAQRAGGGRHLAVGWQGALRARSGAGRRPAVQALSWPTGPQQLLVACGPRRLAAPRSTSVLYTSADGAVWHNWPALVARRGHRRPRWLPRPPARRCSRRPAGSTSPPTTVRLWRQASVSGGLPAGGFSFVGMTNATKASRSRPRPRSARCS